MKLENKIKDYIKLEIETLEKLDTKSIEDVINKLIFALENEKNVYICGNGGSAATSSHICNDFNKAIFANTDKRFKFTCLNDCIPYMLAVANDEGYEEVFRYQLKDKIKKDDIFIGVSGSGNSMNIINAATEAKKVGATVISFTGFAGGKLKKISDLNINTNIDHMAMSEDIHSILDHLIITILYDELGKKGYVKND